VAPSGFDSTARSANGSPHSGYDSNREDLKQRHDPLTDAFKHAQCIATDDPRLKEK
jgi:hypothetical protein